MTANENGTLSFGTAIDMSGFDEGMSHIEQKVSEIGEKAEALRPPLRRVSMKTMLDSRPFKGIHIHLFRDWRN